jgi:hypothetical protein
MTCCKAALTTRLVGAFNDAATSAPMEKVAAARLISALKHENFTTGFDFHSIIVWNYPDDKQSG